MQVVSPEGVTLDMERDVFGKVLQITRAGSGLSARRSYVYDIHQRLCKTIEPETGATVQDHDLADNVAWRASGQPLPSASSCDTASVPAAAKLSFAYDARNRLTATTYGDGSAGITRSYEPDGLLRSVESGGVTWVYGYNRRRLLQSETLSGAGQSFSFNHGIDSHGHRASLSYPSGLALALALEPDALGRPTRVGNHATAVTYHPNGQLAGYTTGSGLSFTVTQNFAACPSAGRMAG